MVRCTFIFASFDYVKVAHALEYNGAQFLKINLQLIELLLVHVLLIVFPLYYVFYFL